jgi:hypothetical protein
MPRSEEDAAAYAAAQKRNSDALGDINAPGVIHSTPKEGLSESKSFGFETPEPPTLVAGAVGISIHINLGSYNNFDIRVEGVNGDHARELLVQESELMMPIVMKIIGDAMKFAASHRY